MLEKYGYAPCPERNIWTRQDYLGIAYSDGDEVETRIHRILKEVSDLSVLSTELRTHCNDWPSLYHFGAARANILRPFEASLREKRVLEIGAGCGAITRFLGEAGASVLALEGSPRRAAIARERTRELNNVTVLSETFEKFECDGGFDVVTLIGVIEYANQFIDGKDSQQAMLERARTLLKPDGILIIAIENALGLKYFAGALEDHLGRPMVSIEGRYRPDGPQTFGLQEWHRLLRRAGFDTTTIMAPFPDYKFPSSILTQTGMESPAFDGGAFAWQSAHSDPQVPEDCHFALELAWPGIFANELGMDLANSFLIAASPRAHDIISPDLLAWHYSTARKAPYCREATFTSTGGPITVDYRRIGSPEQRDVPTAETDAFVQYVCPDKVTYTTGHLLSMELIRLLTHDGWSLSEVGAWLRHYLAIVATLSGHSGGVDDLIHCAGCLPGNMCDATPQNIIVRPDGTHELFDIEWHLRDGIQPGHLAFRSLLRFAASITRFGRCADGDGITWKTFFSVSMRNAGLQADDQLFGRYEKMEAELQQVVTGIDRNDSFNVWSARPLPIRQADARQQVENQVPVLEKRVRALEDERQNLEKRARVLEDERQKMEVRVAERDGQIEYLAALLNASNARMAAIQHSASWIITAPVRVVASLAGALCRCCPPGRWLLAGFGRCHSMIVDLYQGVCRRWSDGMAALAEKRQSTANLPALQALSARRAVPSAMASTIPAAVPESWPEIDITIVSYNSSRWIPSFFASLQAQSYPLDRLHVWVVDHGSQDDSVAMWQKLREQWQGTVGGFQVIEQPNRGFGAGHDRAIRAGRAEFCLITNVDIEFQPQSLCLLVRTALADAQGEVASWEPRQIPFEHPKHYDPVTQETNWSSHACILVRRSCYEKVGGYDPAIFMYGEDVELSYRFRSYGFVLKYVPKATILHHSYETPGQVKPMQYAGSLVGNLIVRLRYGQKTDRRMGALTFATRVLGPRPFKGARVLPLKLFFKALPHLVRRRLAKGHAPAVFPFRDADYELIRDGAFYETRLSHFSADSAPRVTVVTRTYQGRGVRLEQAARSVFNQTYPALEFIIVEDGGNTLESLVADLAAQAPDHVTVRFLAQPKVGRSATGNAGLAAATGDYVVFLDDDDLLFADHVETLVVALQETPDAKAAYAPGMTLYTQPSPTGTGCTEQRFDQDIVFRQEWNYEYLQVQNFISIQSILFQRELYLTRGGFDTTLDQLEDWNLWLRYGRGNHFVYVPKTTSLFCVPADPDLRDKRQELLHAAYEEARSRAMSATEH